MMCGTTQRHHMKKPLHERKKFTVTITEEDRQEAGEYAHNCNCLLSTAVKRLGGKRVVENVTSMWIDGVEFTHQAFHPGDAYRDLSALHRPFYRSEVVGKKITFTRAS